MEVAAQGDVINISARLTSLAGPGEFLVSGYTIKAAKLDSEGLDNSHPPNFLDHSLNTIIYSLELSFSAESAPSPLEQMHAPAPGLPLWCLRGKWLLMHHVPNQD